MMKAGETLKSRGVPMKNKTKRKNRIDVYKRQGWNYSGKQKRKDDHKDQTSSRKWKRSGFRKGQDFQQGHADIGPQSCNCLLYTSRCV